LECFVNARDGVTLQSLRTEETRPVRI